MRVFLNGGDSTLTMATEIGQTLEKNSTVLEYYRENTCIEIKDLFKFLYQSCFGCEHLVSNYDDALKRMINEAELCELDDLPDVEYLDGEYCRIHLKAVNEGNSLERLCRMFIESSGTHPEGEKRLEEQLEILQRYSETGEIRFDEDVLKREIIEWKKLGFPAVHHSDIFREAHHPAYRVILKKYINELKV